MVAWEVDNTGGVCSVDGVKGEGWPGGSAGRLPFPLLVHTKDINMDKLQAFDVLKGFVVASGDEQALEAMRVLVTLPEPPPPQPLGALWHEAAALTNQIRETGERSGWDVPRSRDMPRLLHRFVCLLEQFTTVLGGGMPVKAYGHMVAVQDYLTQVSDTPEGE